MAWSAPVCVEIYENRYVGFENLGLKLTVVKVDYFAGCLLFAHHLKELATAHVVEKEKQGQFCFYHVNNEVLSAYVSELQRRLGLSVVLAAPRAHTKNNI